MGKKLRNIGRNATYPWDKREEENGVLTVPGDLDPLPKRAHEPQKDKFYIKTSAHIQGALNADLDFMPPSGSDKSAHYTVTIDGDVKGDVTVWGNTEVKVGGTVYGNISHQGMGDIHVGGDVKGRISGKQKLEVGGTIRKGAYLSFELAHIKAHEIEAGASVPHVRTIIETEVPYSILERDKSGLPPRELDIFEVAQAAGVPIKDIMRKVFPTIIDVEGTTEVGTPPERDKSPRK